MATTTRKNNNNNNNNPHHRLAGTILILLLVLAYLLQLGLYATIVVDTKQEKDARRRIRAAAVVPLISGTAIISPSRKGTTAGGRIDRPAAALTANIAPLFSSSNKKKNPQEIASNNNNEDHSHVHWLDAIVAAQFPSLMKTQQQQQPSLQLSVVYPTLWEDTCCPEIVQNMDKYSRNDRISYHPELVHVQWDSNSRHDNNVHRQYGIEDHDATIEQGGRTVTGQWPDVLTQLTFISMLKNGHTKLMNSMGDLRQRLEGANATVVKGKKIRSVLEHAANRQQQQQEGQEAGGHVVYAVVRDPVDRFLSATCQEMSAASLLFKLKRGCFFQDGKKEGADASTTTRTSLDYVDCAISHIRDANQMQHHQQSQITQLLTSLQDVRVGVTLIPMEQAFTELLVELGSSIDDTTKPRDRRSHQEIPYQLKSDVVDFCHLQPSDLTSYQIAEICDIYQNDVRMLEFANISVPLCSAPEVTSLLRQNDGRPPNRRTITWIPADARVAKKP